MLNSYLEDLDFFSWFFLWIFSPTLYMKWLSMNILIKNCLIQKTKSDKEKKEEYLFSREHDS